MTRERKELAVGERRELAVAGFEEARGKFDEAKHECLYDERTSLWSVYHKRRQSDRTIKRPISRVARKPYSNGYGKDRRPVVVTLLPHEFIETRLKGTRRRYAISWDSLHALLVRRHALAVMRQKHVERAARRKERGC
jgi:hypothetical protein